MTLTGPVHSAAEKNEAIRLAKTTAGVKRVVSKLVVETAATTGHTDTADKMKARDQGEDRAGQGQGAMKTKEATADASITRR